MMSESVRLASFGTSVSLIGTRLSGKMLLHTCSIFFNNLWIPHVERPWNFLVWKHILWRSWKNVGNKSVDSKNLSIYACVDGGYMMLDQFWADFTLPGLQRNAGCLMVNTWSFILCLSVASQMYLPTKTKIEHANGMESRLYPFVVTQVNKYKTDINIIFKALWSYNRIRNWPALTILSFFLGPLPNVLFI
jgi:hypothetical protein